MALELNGPLSSDDLTRLRSRYPESYVARQVELHGSVDGVEESTSEAVSTVEEDLIGDTATEDADGAQNGSYDVLGSTEPEVREWASTASDEDKAAALASEQAREDRDPRKGVVSLLS